MEWLSCSDARLVVEVDKLALKAKAENKIYISINFCSQARGQHCSKSLSAAAAKCVANAAFSVL